MVEAFFLNPAIHSYAAMFMLALAPITFLSLQYISAPYGKFVNNKKPYTHKPITTTTIKPKNQNLINARLAWFCMECPNLLWCIFFLNRTPISSMSSQSALLLLMFMGHYINRTLVFPFRLKASSPMPLHVMLCALFFCTINGWLQTFSICRIKSPTPAILFTLGAFLFLLGFFLNMQADEILRNLRKPSDKPGTYKIPRGGLFEYVSGGNYAGECLEWLGFALANNTPAAWGFFFFTFANVGPRANDTHKWYLQKFKDYEKLGRSAIIPGVY